MAALSEEEKSLKVRLSWEAFYELCDQSVLENYVTPKKIASAVNSSEYAKSFETQLHYNSLKQPGSTEFKKLKKAIDDFRVEFKKRKLLVDKKIKEEIANLNEQIDNLTIQNTQLIHLKRESENEKNETSKSLDKYKKENKELRDQIVQLRKK
ncbi:hypothetical protein MN086_03235 [Sulfurovum sp. XGS-02]|uniref:hypothetical protein n=1 Tax=Sulfurovum sp. XGS-02 TaxID=2925411 RepID=UPI002068A581|nr:hypothetical protein [Sulfurovum sp. XGS-02]UPT78166.1 hypothetical protein MN086_03235 [Sulfurovum sp. XGS-02]